MAALARPARCRNEAFTGFYGYAAYMLTGETRPFRGGNFDRVRPFKELGKDGLGAFEVALRYDSSTCRTRRCWRAPATKRTASRSASTGISIPYAKLMFNWVRFSGDNTPLDPEGSKTKGTLSQRVFTSTSEPQSSPLPGFGLSLGITIFWAVADRPDPARAVFVKSLSGGLGRVLGRRRARPRARRLQADVRRRLRAPRVNACSGCSSPGCWSATAFAGKRLLGALIDLPFALPTAVAGIALTALYADTGLIGRCSRRRDADRLQAAGVVVALTFIGLPFVVRTVEPVLAEVSSEMEEAALTLGASGCRPSSE
jgi:hypothetical protein